VCACARCTYTHMCPVIEKSNVSINASARQVPLFAALMLDFSKFRLTEKQRERERERELGRILSRSRDAFLRPSVLCPRCCTLTLPSPLHSRTSLLKLTKCRKPSREGEAEEESHFHATRQSRFRARSLSFRCTQQRFKNIFDTDSVRFETDAATDRLRSLDCSLATSFSIPAALRHATYKWNARSSSHWLASSSRALCDQHAQSSSPWMNLVLLRTRLSSIAPSDDIESGLNATRPGFSLLVSNFPHLASAMPKNRYSREASSRSGLMADAERMRESEERRSRRCEITRFPREALDRFLGSDSRSTSISNFQRWIMDS